MTLWETVWNQVRAEMPQPESRPRSWGGALGATVAALVIIAIWFPIRLIHELLRAVDLSEKPDHEREARELFREAYSLSCDLPSKSEFAESVLRHTDLPRNLHDAFLNALRTLYAENMMLDVPPTPADLNNLDGIRWRDRMRREIGRMNTASLIAMRKACLAGIEAATASLPKIIGEREVTSPLSSSYVRERSSKP